MKKKRLRHTLNELFSSRQFFFLFFFFFFFLYSISQTESTKFNLPAKLRYSLAHNVIINIDWFWFITSKISESQLCSYSPLIFLNLSTPFFILLLNASIPYNTCLKSTLSHSLHLSSSPRLPLSFYLLPPPALLFSDFQRTEAGLEGGEARNQ